MIVSDREALFAAILAAPDDDLPRLVFADYLDEQGHPALAARAAFIRLQVETEKLPVGSAVRLELNRRAGELRPQFRDEWADAFAPGELTGAVVNYRRGFVDEVQLELGRLLAVGDRMFAAAPVRVLRVRYQRGPDDPANDRDRFSGMECLQRVRILQFGPHLRDRTGGPLESLTMCQYMTNVRRLELSNNELDDYWPIAFAQLFAGSPLAGSLRELDLSLNQLTDRSAHTLAAATWPHPLTELNLKGNRFTPAGVDTLRRRFGNAVRV